MSGVRIYCATSALRGDIWDHSRFSSGSRLDSCPGCPNIGSGVGAAARGRLSRSQATELTGQVSVTQVSATGSVCHPQLLSAWLRHAWERDKSASNTSPWECSAVDNVSDVTKCKGAITNKNRSGDVIRKFNAANPTRHVAQPVPSAFAPYKYLLNCTFHFLLACPSRCFTIHLCINILYVCLVSPSYLHAQPILSSQTSLS